MISPEQITIRIRENRQEFTTDVVASLRIEEVARVSEMALMRSRESRDDVMRQAIRQAGLGVWRHLYGDLRHNILGLTREGLSAIGDFNRAEEFRRASQVIFDRLDR